MSSGDLNIQREPAVPAKIEEKRTGGIKADYRLVVLQANAVGFGASLVLSGLIAAVFAFGPLVFWIVTGIVGATTLIWWLRQEGRIVYLLDEGKISNDDTTSINVGQGIIVTLFSGFVAWCFWRVLDYVNPRAWTELGWREMVIRGGALVSLELVVFAVFRFVFLFVAFGQEMVQRSPMQEQFIWQALGEILKAWGMSHVRRAGRGRRPIYQSGRPITSNGGNGGNGAAREPEPEPEEELSPEQEDGLELMQFLVLGQSLANGDGTPILYSRRQWNGIRLPSGRVMGVSRARAWAKLLSEAGILEVQPTATGEGLNIARGLTLDDALNRLAVAYDVRPPHSGEREAWVRGVGVPAQPIPTHPTQG